MEKSIDDIEFRKLVLKMYDEGNDIKNISSILDSKEWLVKSVIFTFNDCLNIEEKLNNGKYTKEEEQFFKENHDKDVSFFIKNLKRQYAAVNSKLFKVKKEIKKDSGEKMNEKIQNNGKKYTEEEKNFIKESYENGDSIKDISIATGRSNHSIEYIIRSNKFKRKEEVIPEGYKMCSRCREIKPIDDFYKRKRGGNRVNSYCKACDCIKRKLNKEKEKNGK